MGVEQIWQPTTEMQFEKIRRWPTLGGKIDTCELIWDSQPPAEVKLYFSLESAGLFQLADKQTVDWASRPESRISNLLLRRLRQA